MFEVEIWYGHGTISVLQRGPGEVKDQMMQEHGCLQLGKFIARAKSLASRKWCETIVASRLI